MNIKQIALLLLHLIPCIISAQQTDTIRSDDDKLLKLLSAKSANIIQIDGKDLRKVVGPAQFLHNNTHIICDTAIWDVKTNRVDAIGNVQILQEKTMLYSDRIHYVADSSLAQARGHLVELLDKEGDCLRTHYLDYNTKDSIAFFYNGGSMRDLKGNTIESLTGRYESKINKFSFFNQVEMYIDSVTIKSDSIAYFNDTQLTKFIGKTHAWKDSSYLRSNKGWNDKINGLYSFFDQAYILSGNQEIWSDSLFYDQRNRYSELFNNIQMRDSAQNTILFGDYAIYRESPFFFELRNRPSAAYYYEDSKNIRDTTFLSSDTLRYYTKQFSEIDSLTVKRSINRYNTALKDPVTTLLTNLKKTRDDKKSNNIGEIPKNSSIKGNTQNIDPPDSLKRIDPKETLKGKDPTDSLKLSNPPDTLRDKNTTDSLKLSNPTDTLRDKNTTDSLKLSNPTDTLKDKNLNDSLKVKSYADNFKDTTTIRFIDAIHNVKIYKTDLQGKGDSLLTNSIDSIGVMYGSPILWNETAQFLADSIQFVTHSKKLTKVELMSNAFYATEEDTTHYNQIKGTDIIGHFRDNKLETFDVLGGVNLIFFLAEDSVITTMNEKRCKFMTAFLDEKKLQKVKYYSDISSEIFPVAGLDINKKRLKGFTWREDERPKSRAEVCDRNIVKSEIGNAESIARPLFLLTVKYFNTDVISPSEVKLDTAVKSDPPPSIQR